MNELEIKLVATGLLTFGSASMIFARRWNNPDKEAGYGIAGWTMFVLIFMWS